MENIKTWQERCDISRRPEGQVETAMAAHIADLEAALANQADAAPVGGDYKRAAFEFYESNKEDFMANGDHEIVQACFAHFAALAQRVVSKAVPYGWVQFIDGVKTQIFARDESELNENKRMFKLMGLTEKTEFVPVYTTPPAAPVAAEGLIAAAERMRKAKAHAESPTKIPAFSEAHEYQAAVQGLIAAACAAPQQLAQHAVSEAVPVEQHVVREPGSVVNYKDSLNQDIWNEVTRQVRAELSSAVEILRRALPTIEVGALSDGDMEHLFMLHMKDDSLSCGITYGRALLAAATQKSKLAILREVTLPPYIYGRETAPNEKVWTEQAVMAIHMAATASAEAVPVSDPLPEGWSATHMPSWDALTPAAQHDSRISVKREVAPFCDKNGHRAWSAPTLHEALERACIALDLPLYTSNPPTHREMTDTEIDALAWEFQAGGEGGKWVFIDTDFRLLIRKAIALNSKSAELSELSDAEINELLVKVGPTAGTYPDSRDMSLAKINKLVRLALAAANTKRTKECVQDS